MKQTPKKTRVDRRAAYLRVKSPSRPKRRKCDRCGKVGYYAVGATACQQLIGLLGTYRCPGKLAVIPRKPKPVKEALAEMAVEAASEDTRAMKLRSVIDRKRQHALTQTWSWQKRFNDRVGYVRRYGTPKWALKLADAARELNAWAKKVERYEARLRLTDDQLVADADKKRQAFTRKAKRGIKIGGVV